MQNPFHASFGVSPPLLVGRDEVLEDFVAALEDGPGSAGRATLYTGARGAGKTVMLNAVEDRAREQGWLVVSETATAGFVFRMTQQHLPRLLRDFDPDAVRRRMTGVTAPLNVGAVTWNTIEAHVVQAGLRNQLEMLTDLLAEHRTGVLLTLDEIHQNQIEELRELPPPAHRSRADLPDSPRLRRLRLALPARVPPRGFRHRGMTGPGKQFHHPRQLPRHPFHEHPALPSHEGLRCGRARDPVLAESSTTGKHYWKLDVILETGLSGNSKP